MSDIDESLEQLLSNASPRPLPSQADATVARQVVHDEWLAVSSRHRTRRLLLRLAVAATILVSVVALFNVLREPTVDIAQVASIQKSFGSIYFLGEQSELTRADSLAAVYSGQTIVTGDDAGMALSWGSGGSLRLDAATEVKFSDNNTVYLRFGRVYFDSMPSGLIAAASVGGAAAFQVETEHGTVSHVGTQFMAQVDADELRVSVREGQVDVVGRYYPHTVSRGEQVVYSGRQRPVVSSVAEYGGAWDWIGRTSPIIDVDGRTLHAFLIWVGRELGRDIEYADAAVETMARQALLVGRVDREPAEELRLRMLTVALDWRYLEGVIYVSNNN